MISVLVIAGSDSGGGAGIQADLKALASIGVHACTAITCVTAQNTQGVLATHPLPVDAVRDQVRAVLDDIEVEAVKTGMLYSEQIVRAVAEELESVDRPTVVDPVMVATSGAFLHESGFTEALRKHLLPRATLVTPNLDEATALSGVTIGGQEDMERCARAIAELGPEAVLVKGGHLEGDLVDLLFDGKEIHRFTGHRYPTELHGSGCAYASTIAGYLAKGWDIVESVRQARQKIAAGFDTAYAVGKGFEVINSAYVDDKWGVWHNLYTALDDLLDLLPPELIPEVGVNLGYALPGAQDSNGVCAIEGRIVQRGGRVTAVGPPAFGTSRHVARVILSAMVHEPTMRSAMNVKYSDELVKRSKEAGLEVGSFDRAEEPDGVSSMEWGTGEAIRRLGKVPDVIYDLGGPSKVPMFRILARNPEGVLEKLRLLVGRE